MKANYHTHTIRCQHASGSDESYVLSAIKTGFEELGFSDHTPWHYDTDFISHMRMHENELQGYLESVRCLKEKYKDQISIKIGLECEYFPKYMPWLKEMIEREKLDYVIFGNHYYLTDEEGNYMGYNMDDQIRVQQYVDTCIEGMESGVYAYLAHPDLFLRGYHGFDEIAAKACEQICKAAKENDCILEYNLAGKRYDMLRESIGYPNPKFWQIAATYGCKAIVGVDAHNNRHLEMIEDFDKAKKYLKDMGLVLVETIPMRKYTK